MQFLTDFADQAVILPLSAMVAVVLAASGWWRGAAAWVVAVGGVLAVMALLKVFFVACALPLGVLGIHSPSGHTAASAVVYGGIALLLFRGRTGLPLLLVIPPTIAAVFGASRVALHAHGPAEVLLGAAVGLIGAAALLPLAGQPPALRRWPVVVAAAVVIICFHGVRLQAEQVFQNSALWTWLPLPLMCRA